MSFRWWSDCRTDRGNKRKLNEDAYLDKPEVGVWAVADGMGGHSRGDWASQRFVEVLSNIEAAADLDTLVARTRHCIEQANQQIYEEAANLGEGHTMGCTVAVLVASGAEFACLWAGDSRIYRLRGGELTQLTKDHSVVQQLVDAGEIQPWEARNHPQSNRISRAVGARATVRVDESRDTLVDGDVLMLCSDGLVREVEDDEITAILDGGQPQDAATELLDLTLARGARDNVTLLVVRIQETTGIDWSLRRDHTAINYAFRKQLVERRRTATGS